jgi:hypothetical protein
MLGGNINMSGPKSNSSDNDEFGERRLEPDFLAAYGVEPLDGAEDDRHPREHQQHTCCYYLTAHAKGDVVEQQRRYKEFLDKQDENSSLDRQRFLDAVEKCKEAFQATNKAIQRLRRRCPKGNLPSQHMDLGRPLTPLPDRIEVGAGNPWLGPASSWTGSAVSAPYLHSPDRPSPRFEEAWGGFVGCGGR